MSRLLFESRGGKSSSHPSQKGAQEALLFFWPELPPPGTSPLSPLPSPSHPSGRGGPCTTLCVYRVRFVGAALCGRPGWGRLVGTPPPPRAATHGRPHAT